MLKQPRFDGISLALSSCSSPIERLIMKWLLNYSSESAVCWNELRNFIGPSDDLEQSYPLVYWMHLKPNSILKFFCPFLANASVSVASNLERHYPWLWRIRHNVMIAILKKLFDVYPKPNFAFPVLQTSCKQSKYMRFTKIAATFKYAAQSCTNSLGYIKRTINQHLLDFNN